MSGRPLALLLVVLAVRAAPLGAQPPREPPIVEPGREDLTGAPASFAPPAGEASIRVEAGTPLFKAPRFNAAVLTRIDEAVELPVLERQGSWARVWFGSWKGWIGDPQEIAAERAAAADPAEVLRPEAAGLAEAAPLGAFRFLTDVEDEALLEGLRRVAEQVPAAYRERYGIEVADPDGDVWLFAREQSYTELEERWQQARGPEATLEHTRAGIAVLYAESWSLEELQPQLVHELTHLLNRRVFSRELPLWLAEGLPNDLAFGDIDRRGRLRPDRLGGEGKAPEGLQVGQKAEGPRLRFRLDVLGPPPFTSTGLLTSGQFAALIPALLDVLAFEGSAEDFGSGVNRQFFVFESALFVRFLLDRKKLATPFLALLDEAREGDAPLGAGFHQAIGLEEERLEKAFGRWIADLAHRQQRALATVF